MPTAAATATGRGLCKLYEGQCELRLSLTWELGFVRPALRDADTGSVGAKRSNVYVYFIKTKAHPQMMKIGKASDVERRIAELQTGCPYDLQLVGSVKCKSDGHARGIEKKAHRLFRHERSRGEWFHYSRRVHLAVMALLQVPADQMGDATSKAFAEDTKRYRANRGLRQRIAKAREGHAELNREFRAIVG